MVMVERRVVVVVMNQVLSLVVYHPCLVPQMSSFTIVTMTSLLREREEDRGEEGGEKERGGSHNLILHHDKCKTVHCLPC